ncbi:MAG: hypothetical protein L6R42_009142 [Xanthoria sp. 1 TBL-2021]|nr:MAG: hypothetical protein L6R42_009142 [Xanthoria sp. 1 TBL-2021]
MVVYDEVLRDTITESGPYYIINSVQLQKLLSREIQDLQSRSVDLEAALKTRKAQQQEAERKGYLSRTPESTGTGFNQPEDYMEAYKRHQQAHFGISPHASATVGMTAIQPHQQISEIEGWKRGRVQTMAPVSSATRLLRHTGMLEDDFELA